MLQLSEVYAWVFKWLTLHLWAGNLMSLVLFKRGPLDMHKTLKHACLLWTTQLKFLYECMDVKVHIRLCPSFLHKRAIILRALSKLGIMKAEIV